MVPGSNRNGNWDIWVIPAQGGTARRITIHPSSDGYAHWSPDGRWLFFTSNRTGKNQLWRVPAEGGRPELVTDRRDGHGIYSTDGKKFLYTKEGNVWEIPAEGGAERQLTDLEGRSFGGIPQTDGKYIYFLWQENIGDIWVMDVVGE